MSTGPSEGTFVDDARRYALESRIATGGMGEVWRGTDTVLGRAVAIKLLKAEYADNATFRSRFETEARHAASLLHPGVAAVYDFGEASPTDGSDVHRPYLVMELVDGQPLSALLAAGRALDPAVTQDLLAQAADAIGAAHAAGIVHRDVKPANLLVTPDRQVKITDFGIARATEGMALTETGQVMGTPQYLSPEQAQGGTATPASDVYSLGVVAFECLAGERPYVRETAVATALAHLREPVPDLPADVPADLAAVVKRAMSKSPEDRFPDATAFAAALRDPSSLAPLAAAGAAGAAAGLAGAGAAAATDDAGTQVMGAVPPPVTSAATPGDAAPAAGTARSRTAPWGWVLLALAIVAGIVLVAVLASGNDDEPDTPAPTPTKTERTSRPEPTEETSSEAPSETVEPSQTPSETPSESPSETASESPSATLPTETATTESSSPSPSSSSSSPATTSSPSAGSSTSSAPAPSQSSAPSEGASISGDGDQ